MVSGMHQDKRHTTHTSDGDLNIGGSSESESGLSTSSTALRQVHLGTDTVDELRSRTVDLLNEVNKSGQLGVDAIQVVVVNVELGVGVGFSGSLEGDGDEALAEDVREDGGAQGTVLVEDLVDDVPGPDLTGVASGDGGDVVLDDGGQCGLVANSGNP